MSTYTIGQDEQLDEELEDPGLWEASSEEGEDWSGMDLDQQWPVHIAGEEVRNGETRYEIVWETWERKDGTNSTWDEEDIQEDDNVLKTWKKESGRHRKKLAEESSDINIWTDLDLLSTDTHFHAQAGHEKLAASRRGRSHRPNLVARMRELEIKHGLQPERQEEQEQQRQEEKEEPAPSSSRRRPSPGPSTRPAKRRQTTDPRSDRSTSHDQLRFISSSVGDSASASGQSQRSSTLSSDQLRFVSPMGPPPSVASSSSASGQTPSSSSTKNLRMLSETPVPSTSTPNLKKRFRDSDVTMREASTSSSTTRKRGRPRIITSDSEDDNHSMTLRETPTRRERPSTTPPQVSVKGKEKAVPQARVRRAPSEVYIRGPRQEILQRQWNTIAKRAGAQGITIVNDIDDEEIPILASDFEYLENDYISGIGRDISDPEGFFEFCTHRDRACTNAKKCGCQQAHPVLDSRDSPTFPYSEDNEGYFIYYDEVDNEGPILVVECNQLIL
ncbi:hypothetical protein MPER_13275 [Moniliophthora perniciosa FA553]|nr:hypothetical protein MPER_13275 [Moniliophthora perniciosa FA553]